MYILILQHCIQDKINNTNTIKSYSKYDLRNAILEPKIILTVEIIMIITLFNYLKIEAYGLA